MAVFVVLLCIVLETLEQTVFTLSSRIPAQWVFWIGMGILVHIVATACWFWLLTLVPLGVAMPMMGGCYATVCIVSWLFFKERIRWLHWVGIVSIIFGLFLIGKSGFDL